MKQLFTTPGGREFGLRFLECFGGLWLIYEPAIALVKNWEHPGIGAYFLIVFLAGVAALICAWPRKSISTTLKQQDTVIRISEGDLFANKCHLVVGTNDVFDTELGEVIKAGSVQGQFQKQCYSGDRMTLDADIEAALEARNIKGKIDRKKTRGKNRRFPIGTTLALGDARKFYLSAYSNMDENLVCHSSADQVWSSLNKIWSEIRATGHGEAVAMPIVGSDLARTGLSRMALVRIIVLSFVAASASKFVSKELTICVHLNDAKHLNFYALSRFLATIKST